MITEKIPTVPPNPASEPTDLPLNESLGISLDIGNNELKSKEHYCYNCHKFYGNVAKQNGCCHTQERNDATNEYGLLSCFINRCSS